MNLLYICHFF